ncbi:acyl-CoA dehydrogenase, middle domain protein [Mycobacterium xenopi 4042]|uniref:Acyl-[acyl-carrier-protein] dehydrogenase MbtN n=1 Tax=Mycobacterium xenopi 4042 TaxID=1299334 RepID=X8AGA5_MYCXE|nr:acyl-CoA dehydrogenase, middle domain protein [Mycobacterium xenopi 4042]
MTEPGAGSDLAGIRTSAVRDGEDWIINGSKTFISSGINCDLVVVVTRTDPEAGHKGFTLLVVERGMEGFTRGRKLDKMGLHSQDTAELHFENVRVPASNVLGQEGRGFYHLMHNLPSERLSIAISAIAGPVKPGAGPCSTPRTAKPSANRSEPFSTTGSCSRKWTPNLRSASTTSTGVFKRWSTAS